MTVMGLPPPTGVSVTV
jgi:hypothetical protein